MNFFAKKSEDFSLYRYILNKSLEPNLFFY